jgi:hypothetical protein
LRLRQPRCPGATVALNYTNRIRIVEGDLEVWPGVRVHRVGGHTAGLQIITSLPEMLTAFETIDRLAGSAKLVVAGHDSQVADRFKPVEPGIIKIA